jgi:hypothetical protein
MGGACRRRRVPRPGVGGGLVLELSRDAPAPGRPRGEHPPMDRQSSGPIASGPPRGGVSLMPVVVSLACVNSTSEISR